MSGRVREALERVPPEATGAVVIDLGRLRANFRTLRAMASPSECAAVVKADAYGLGVAHVLPALLAEGARGFFVATVAEGREVRRLAPSATIYVLGGLLPGTAPAVASSELRPVLNSLAELEEWDGYCRTTGRALPAALQIDTGLNRLGMPLTEAQLAATRKPAFEIALVMSHLACADERGHAMSRAQLKAFERIARHFPGVPRAIANSAGAIVSPPSRFELFRPGIALYGCRTIAGEPVAHQRVVAVMARVLQTRSIAPGDSIGYGATETVPTDRAGPLAAATLGIGYADGLPRSAGRNPGSPAFVLRLPDGAPAALLGRVSMDSCVIDISASPNPQAIECGDWVTVAGLDPPFPAIDDLADASGTIGYEILTRLGSRLARVLIDSED